MKKFALLLAAFLIAQTAQAYVTEYKTSDIKSFLGSGYSQDTLKALDTIRYINQGDIKDYVPFYPTEFYSKNPARKWYQAVKRYVDPLQDKHTFGVSEIIWDNQAYELSPSFYEPNTPNNKYIRYHERDLKRLEQAGTVVKGSGGVEEPIEDQNNLDADRGFVLESL